MSKQRIILVVVAVIVVVGAGVLLLSNPQAPQNPVEKQLDAKTILDSSKP